MMLAIPEGFRVIHEPRAGLSELADYSIATPSEDPKGVFLKDSLAYLLGQRIWQMLPSLRRGIHQYQGAGRILTLAKEDLRSTFLIAAGMSGILSQDEVDQAANSHWDSLQPMLSTRLGAMQENASLAQAQPSDPIALSPDDERKMSAFRKHFDVVARQMIRVFEGTVSDLAGWRLTYPDGTLLSMSMPGRLVVGNPLPRHRGRDHMLQEGETPEEMITAFERYLGCGEIDIRYALPLALRYNLNREVIPESALGDALVHDLGL